jgi:hypothetical protein
VIALEAMRSAKDSLPIFEPPTILWLITVSQHLPTSTHRALSGDDLSLAAALRTGG